MDAAQLVSRFAFACQVNRVEEVKEILRNPTFNVNAKTGPCKWAGLHEACANGNDETVAILLAHPRIDVNVLTEANETPLSWACYNQHMSTVRLVLKDPRVLTNVRNETGMTALGWAVSSGRIDIVKWIIAVDKELRADDCYWDNLVPDGHQSLRSLLEDHQRDPAQVRHRVRVELGVYNEMAAEAFAHVVFLCDGLFILRKPKKKKSGQDINCWRFFKIAMQLPLELQMILCHRKVGSMRNNVPGQWAEDAFKVLAKSLT